MDRKFHLYLNFNALKIKEIDFILFNLILNYAKYEPYLRNSYFWVDLDRALMGSLYSFELGKRACRQTS
jgi:hypothetical protein